MNQSWVLICVKHINCQGGPYSVFHMLYIYMKYSTCLDKTDICKLVLSRKLPKIVYSRSLTPVKDDIHGKETEWKASYNLSTIRVCDYVCVCACVFE